MKTYKVIFTVFAAMILSTFVIGCSNDDISDNNSSLVKREVDINLEYIELKTLVFNHLEYLQDKDESYLKGLTEEEAINSLAPITNATMRVLQSYGISESEISDEFGSIDDPRLALVGISIVAANGDFDMDKAIDCLVEALGLNVFDAIREVGEVGTKKALIKIVRGVASRFLGPIGMAITVAEWAWCYGR